MVTLDDSYIEKSSNSDDEQDNIYLMVDTDEKVKVKTCSESDTSSNASSNDEEDMPYDVLLQNCHISLVGKGQGLNWYLDRRCSQHID
ncbi:hypothetical protein JHK82_016072 [Glycine max]|nr:hypothetical protein JHK82_016072 [Glycine max]